MVHNYILVTDAQCNEDLQPTARLNILQHKSHNGIAL